MNIAKWLEKNYWRFKDPHTFLGGEPGTVYVRTEGNLRCLLLGGESYSIMGHNLGY